MIIKVCGLREMDNIRAISELGVDWLGLIFYPKSSRYVGEDVLQVEELLESGLLELPQKRVGVFVNSSLERVQQLIERFSLDMVQLHGDEDPSYCEELRASSNERTLEIIKAFSVHDEFDFAQTEAYRLHCDYFLFDTKGKQRGGTGKKFNWEVLDRYTGSTPFLLSGGIGPEDAPSVSKVAHPSLAGVDLNSRFELLPGRKDVLGLKRFIEELS